MSENRARRMAQLGAVFYVLWGVLHVLAALRVGQLGSTLDAFVKHRPAWRGMCYRSEFCRRMPRSGIGMNEL